MELNKQVCSLEYAKKLNELGIKKNSLWWWVNDNPSDKKQNWFIMPHFNLNKTDTQVRIPALTVAELGEMLPQIIKIKKINYQLFISVALDKQWFVVYANEEDYHDNAPIKLMICHKLADAMVKMLIYLIENNLIKK